MAFLLGRYLTLLEVPGLATTLYPLARSLESCLPSGRRVCVCNPWSHRDAFAFFFVLSQGIYFSDAGDFHGRHPTKTPWISCDVSRGRLTHVPALLPTLQSPPLFFAVTVVLTIDPQDLFPPLFQLLVTAAFCRHAQKVFSNTFKRADFSPCCSTIPFSVDSDSG